VDGTNLQARHSDESGFVAPLAIAMAAGAFLAKEAATEAVVQTAYHVGGDMIGDTVQVLSMFGSPTQMLKGVGKGFLKHGGPEAVQAGFEFSKSALQKAMSKGKCFVAGSQVLQPPPGSSARGFNSTASRVIHVDPKFLVDCIRLWPASTP